MDRFVIIARAAVVATALLALLPLARLVQDYMAVTRLVVEPAVAPTARGYDWVSWEEADGQIRAAHVFRRTDTDGLREGDVFFQLDFQQYFTLEDLQRAIEGIPPGDTRVFTVFRDGRVHDVEVTFTRYPTFMYPLAPPLWGFALWGFLVGAFLHVLGLVIAGPLARHSRSARFSLLLIAVSSLWLFGNLLRLLMVELLGPPPTGSPADTVFQALTLLGLVGWIGFPALLLHRAVADAERLGGRRVGGVKFAVYGPVGVLGLLALLTTLLGAVGPLTLDGLVGPILFYACCYVAAAAAFGLTHSWLPAAESDEAGGWSPLGSALMLVVALLFGLSILGVVPVFGAVTEVAAGWIIVSAQLLSVAPVVLVSLATLRHGKVDQVLRRALTYLTVLGLIFFAFIGGMTVLEPWLERNALSTTLVAGLYVVVLLVVFERLARRLRVYAAQFFATDRQQARQQLSRFQERMRAIRDYETLARETIEAVGAAFRSRSGRLFLRPGGPDAPWVSSAFHPEPPYFTERVLRLVWPHFEEDGAIWGRNPELDESRLPDALAALMVERGVALAVPILGEGAPIGLLVLGPRRTRGSVYNLEDLDLLRALSGQLALAVERLNLIERERALIRESAEAQLSALRAQINPHFLFNALNTIVSLITEQPAQAVEAVEHLAAIFRHILQTGGRAFVSVQEEFGLVDHYLAIEEMRFGERLRIERHIDPLLHTHPVP
ncbi:MAG: histidine kinase, partial [Rhodothermales bacterium]|nr:histidine kinase [Rhodothermales bacterium]